MLKVSEEEKKDIRRQHEEAIKKTRDRQKELEQGLQKPKEPKKEK